MAQQWDTGYLIWMIVTIVVAASALAVAAGAFITAVATRATVE